MTNRRKLIKTYLLLTLGVFVISCKSQKENTLEKPNIIFIISDDQAYDDYSFMGHPSIETPNIDQLAEESLTFTRGYASAPLCSPSLASIITGLYAFQHGITGNDPVVEPKETEDYAAQRNRAYQSLADRFYENKLITQTLSEKGYRSFQSGKWWVGSAEDAGFDQGMTHGDYRRGGRHGDEGLKIGREGLQPIYDFIEATEASGQPFFIWYAPFLPHRPHNPPRDLEEKYSELAPSPTVARYWAMVEWFDQTVGALNTHLKEKGLDKNTIIVYVCDNGWIQSEDSPGYAPRSKRSPFEGGIRSPLMFKYPTKISPRLDRSNVVSAVDIVPTIHRLLGIEAQGLPGIDVLDEKAIQNRETVFAEAYNHDITNISRPTESILYKIAIEKDWKLLIPNPGMVKAPARTQPENRAGFYDNEIQLYHLTNDPFELKNVADDHPEVVDRLSKKITDWWQAE
ncbi:MAG TPA: sulfatase [Saprospiraceae bacterium]|nr:sulfatase [Saprospiraceae bacterium]